MLFFSIDERDSVVRGTSVLIEPFDKHDFIAGISSHEGLEYRFDIFYVHDFCPVDVENDKSVVYAGFLELSFFYLDYFYTAAYAEFGFYGVSGFFEGCSQHVDIGGFGNVGIAIAVFQYRILPSGGI